MADTLPYVSGCGIPTEFSHPILVCLPHYQSHRQYVLFIVIQLELSSSPPLLILQIIFSFPFKLNYGLNWKVDTETIHRA